MPTMPEILDENDTPGRPKESCTSEPGYPDGTQNHKGPPTPRTAPKPPINNTSRLVSLFQPSIVLCQGPRLHGNEESE
jgi:hypothetical protein